MTRSVLIEKVAERAEGLTLKQTEIVVETVFESIKDALRGGEKIEIRGFGNFRLKDRKPRKARNPKTGEVFPVQNHGVPVFRPGQELKQIAWPMRT